MKDIQSKIAKIDKKHDVIKTKANLLNWIKMQPTTGKHYKP